MSDITIDDACKYFSRIKQIFILNDIEYFNLFDYVREFRFESKLNFKLFLYSKFTFKYNVKNIGIKFLKELNYCLQQLSLFLQHDPVAIKQLLSYKNVLDRKYRLAARVREMFEKNVKNGSSCERYFLTLTFNDSTLDRIKSGLNHRLLVSRWLKANCNKYVANIDYGSLKGRLHYHAIVLADDYSKLRSWYDHYKYGTIHIEYVYSTTGDKMSFYISKFINHALKDSTCKVRCIVWRRPKFKCPYIN